MIIQELIKILKEKGVNDKLYTFDGASQEDKIVLQLSTNHYANNNDYKEWRVFYFERGVRYDEKVYFSENEACIDMLNRLIHYKTH
ncbi:hypothetical protein SAMN05428975_4456 [Mucilaginibacter sp. OK268]|uniref:hypothetical protein n=1 Tax=Mucilaginibacter sp. OK268 TaxID=1881048 RepID=UPI000884D078|nr:hypothetical protein [Mucilaginibacter sp. OK268]SDP97643.1 hypothetical protein SAMN05428975_4456 [Mucilaginibacter sp. OK268]